MRLLVISALVMCSLAATSYNLTKNEFSVDIYYEDKNTLEIEFYFQEPPKYSDNMYMAVGFGSTVLRAADVYVCKRVDGGSMTVSDHYGNSTELVKYLDIPEDAETNSINTLTTDKSDFSKKKGWYCHFTRPMITDDHKEDMSFGLE